MKTESKPEVVIRSQVVSEDLPMKRVYYPNHYGTFFAFAEHESGTPVLCSCVEGAVANLARLITMDGSVYGDPLKMAPLSSRYFPDRIASMSLSYSYAFDAIELRPGLCHRCTGSKPTLRYCHEMYGTEFTQYYGWYIGQVYLRFGILPLRLICLTEVCPPEFQEMLDQPRLLHNSVENVARKEIGFPAIGEGSVSETLLFNIVKNILPGEEILRHQRPEWLCGLELDIFMPRLRLAIEYQGIQHFQPVAWWGGEAALLRRKECDRRKASLCRSNSVRLVCFSYEEPATEEHVASRLGIEMDSPGRRARF